jgi:hypothetical protein
MRNIGSGGEISGLGNNMARPFAAPIVSHGLTVRRIVDERMTPFPKYGAETAALTPVPESCL